MYPGAATVRYLDTAAVGLISTWVEDAMADVLRRHRDTGIDATVPLREEAESVRERVARLIHGDARRVTFTQNTSTGLALVANGVDWRPGDNLVVPEREFPSNFYPWLQLRQQGVEVRAVPMGAHGHAETADIAERVDVRTRLVALSAVQYSSGHRYDLAEIGAVCRNHGALLVVDGTQAAGAMALNVNESGIDVLSVSAHKWMLGPFGIGFVHFSDRAFEQLTPSTAGWLSTEKPFDFDHEPTFASDGRKFESGTENSVGIAGLGATIDHMLDLGPERIEQYILDLVGQLVTTLEERGFTMVSPRDARHQSGIVIARSPVEPGEVLHERLLKEGIRCSLRGGGVRLSPHYFITGDDISHAISVMAR
ncbi:aminotransferase class V-fold PLP-dependent enzyme [Streptomyces canus]|uniref:aminotransferase class V-fold PLP-dependent enzyme n=1 Tax=Streptomyces TaxID=1883 RepID=UPI0008517537|nr:aminotransferase class V-fold PLP-dependent enzyme [Streptomyces sp. LUP47B]